MNWSTGYWTYSLERRKRWNRYFQLVEMDDEHCSPIVGISRCTSGSNMSAPLRPQKSYYNDEMGAFCVLDVSIASTSLALQCALKVEVPEREGFRVCRPHH